MKLTTTAKLPKKTSAKVNDSDNPAWTEDLLGAPVLKRGRGPQATPTKVLTSVRLDADILDFFKSKGAGYQSRINAALRMEVERKLTGRPRAPTRTPVAS
ncbi:BrnA antitoxin family protein [Limnohabitans sp. Rim8]|uniref:BrnA antitoxin family protein n=1 Tax=Limnohabitans sp. Rim8 TaxID=1100718 RepID=UPI0033066925